MYIRLRTFCIFLFYVIQRKINLGFSKGERFFFTCINIIYVYETRKLEMDDFEEEKNILFLNEKYFKKIFRKISKFLTYTLFAYSFFQNILCIFLF